MKKLPIKTLEDLWRTSISTAGFKEFALIEGYTEEEISNFKKEKLKTKNGK